MAVDAFGLPFFVFLGLDAFAGAFLLTLLDAFGFTAEEPQTSEGGRGESPHPSSHQYTLPYTGPQPSSVFSMMWSSAFQAMDSRVWSNRPS